MSNIFKCARRDDINSLEKLVSEGKDINETTFNNETALHIAAARNSIKVMNFLIKNKANVNAKTELTEETPLFYAVQEGQADAIMALINNGADVNAENIEGETPIFTAMRNNRAELMSILINNGADVNHKNKEGKPPLSVAIMFKSTTMTKKLIDAKANTEDSNLDINELSKLSKIPQSTRNRMNVEKTAPSAIVMTPAETPKLSPRNESKYGRNYEEKAAVLFQYCIENKAQELENGLSGFDVNSAFFDNETLLHCAIENGSIECINVLIKNGANLNVTTKTFHEPAIQAAIYADNMQAVEILFSAGADIEQQNAEGETALFIAVRTGNFEIVKLLIEKPANVNCLNTDGVTPLQVAIQLHQTQIAKALLEAGAAPSLGRFNSYALATEFGEVEICDDVREKDPSLARQAIQKDNKKEKPDPPKQIFNLIRSKNVAGLRKSSAGRYNMNISVADEGVPLIRAIETGSLDIVKVIVNAGADVDYGADVESPLACACRLGKLNIVQYLLQQGANPNARNNDNESALFAAVRSSDQKVVQEIINQDVPINECNTAGMSPLYIAVGMRSTSVVRTLLACGADPNSSGHSPFKLAQDLKLTQIINILVTSGAKAQIKRAARKTRQQNNLLSLTQPIRTSTPLIAEHGKCSICGTKHGLLKLIPCGHAVVCKKCLEKFAEKRSQCPVCTMGFYATSAFN